MRATDRTPRIADPAIRLDTILLLRWLAVAGQILTVVFVAFVLGFALPLAACLTLIALVAWSNVFLRVSFGETRRLPEEWTTLLMGFDILQLAGLFYLTGGLQNPFVVLLLAPVMVSATALPAQRTIALGLLVLLAITLLAVHHHPLPWYPGERLHLPLLYVGAMWVALACSLVFMGGYAFRVAEEGRQLASALAATELVLTREQSLHALDGLAAAAAHELGTPLSTISVVTKELMAEVDPASPLGDDVLLLRTQAERCREILGKLASLGGDSGAPLVRMRLPELIEEVVAPHRGAGRSLTVRLHGPQDDVPVLARNAAILYGLGAIVENAVDFARERVSVEADWDERRLLVAVSDDGHGIRESVLDRLGDPYVTTRGGAASRGGGLGLGFFIAKTLLERTGAALTLGNRPAPESGARVTVTWPREAIEAVAANGRGEGR